MDYSKCNLVELRQIAKTKGVKSVTTLKKEDLINAILEKENVNVEKKIKGIEDIKRELKQELTEKNIEKDMENQEQKEEKSKPRIIDGFTLNSEDDMVAEGVLEILPDGFGFLRGKNYLSTVNDIYVSPLQIRRFRLDNGDKIKCVARKPKEGEKFPALIYVGDVNGMAPEISYRRKKFDDLVPIYPREKIKLETNKNDIATRIIDLVCPIGKGQRGMIVAPPKVGKTTLLKRIANSITTNNPDISLIVLLIDERPEEVTDMERSINGEVIYSTFDELPEHHIKVAEMVLERAKRLVEQSKDVVILMDSITRLARANNLSIPSSGRTLSGGIDPAALHFPKKFFGAARNIENGGSLTILATALVDTGSRMDDVIFEEFKGTGNMEVVLDKTLAERRIYPAINITKSSTRRDDLLLTKEEQEANYKLRTSLENKGASEAAETIIDLIQKTETNAQLLSAIDRVIKR